MENCKTCSALISDQASFCPNCGAKQVNTRLSLGNLFQNLILNLTHFDFPFFITTKKLLIKPESITLSYIRGVRKINSSPIQYALIVLSLYGLFQFLFSDFLDLILLQNFLSGFLEGFTSYETSEVQRYEKMSHAVNWVQSRNQFFLFSIIPCLGLISRAFYKKSAYNLAEHLVIAIYAVSFTLIFNVGLGLILAIVGNEVAADYYNNASLIVSFLAIPWILHRSLKGAILKPILIFITSLLIMSTILFVVLVLVSTR